MRGLVYGVAAAIAAATLTLGCAEAADDVQSNPTPKPVVFDGTADPKFVGQWETENHRSGLDLDKDGKLIVHVVAASPQGDSKYDLEGKWLIDSEGSLLLQYKSKDQSETKIKYKTTLEKGKMTLVLPNGLKTIYLLKPAKAAPASKAPPAKS